MALADSFLQFVQLSLAFGAQRGLAFRLGVASGLEGGLLLSFGRLVGFEQSFLASANGFLLGAAFQSLLLGFEVKTFVAAFVIASVMVLAVLRGEGEVGNILLDASFEVLLRYFVDGLSAFFGLGVVALRTAALAFLLVMLRRRATVVGIAGLELRFQGCEFSFEFFLLLLVALSFARMEILNLLLTGVLGSAAELTACADEAGGENDDSLHDLNSIFRKSKPKR